MSLGGILILGATSSIARATACAFAKKGHPLYLAGRNVYELNRIARDIRLRHLVDVHYGRFDCEAYETHEIFLQGVVQALGNIEGLLLAFGDVGDHALATHDFKAAHAIINRNFTGACSILTYCADYLSVRKNGFIIAISSVAGDRGRQSNYIYGASKGGLNVFLQGLRNRLYSTGVRVITIKPGFVDTGMTFGKSGMFLVASPQKIGMKIANTLHSRRDEHYLPGFWKWILFIIKSIPECLFKRLKL